MDMKKIVIFQWEFKRCNNNSHNLNNFAEGKVKKWNSSNQNYKCTLQEFSYLNKCFNYGYNIIKGVCYAFFVLFVF